MHLYLCECTRNAHPVLRDLQVHTLGAWMGCVSSRRQGFRSKRVASVGIASFSLQHKRSNRTDHLHPEKKLLLSRSFSTMQLLIQLAVLAGTLCLATCAHDLSESYPFKATLNTAENGGLYELYWTFDNTAKTISFAVRVQTTGWVGFGLSPNGQMPNSDVVIGWVDNGETFLHVSISALLLFIYYNITSL